MRGVDWVLYLPACSIEQAAGGGEDRWKAGGLHLNAQTKTIYMQNYCCIAYRMNAALAARQPGSEAARQLGLHVGKAAVRCHQATRPYKMWRERARKTFFHANDAYLPVPTTLPLP